LCRRTGSSRRNGSPPRAATAATGRTTDAIEVANLLVFLCSAANGHVTGELIRADGHFRTPG
jgi:NAD(P)-dependent dehydrogenase (short-subunit alcohol dehydrogenase family)